MSNPLGIWVVGVYKWSMFRVLSRSFHLDIYSTKNVYFRCIVDDLVDQWSHTIDGPNDSTKESTQNSLFANINIIFRIESNKLQFNGLMLSHLTKKCTRDIFIGKRKIIFCDVSIGSQNSWLMLV